MKDIAALARQVDALEARLRLEEDQQALAQLVATYGPEVPAPVRIIYKS